MSYETIIQSIVNVGFPVVMCLLMYYSNQKTIEDLKETITELKTIISNNSMIISNIASQINLNADNFVDNNRRI